MNNRILPNVGAAVLMIGASIALVILRKAGMIDDAPTRGVMAIIGILLALYSNAIPKTFQARSARALTARRISGWAFVLSGLAYAAIWLLAPFHAAGEWSLAVVGTAMVLTVGSCLWARYSRPSAA